MTREQQSRTRRSARLRWALAGTVLATASLLPGIPASAGEEGRVVYEENCAVCHQADGGGIPGATPPLAGNPRAVDLDHLRAVVGEGLSGPIEVDGVVYDGTMPAFPTLTEEEITAVADHIRSLPIPAPAPEAGADAAGGRELFGGGIGFAHGGPACSACHSAGSVGDFSALPATFGPDLTAWAGGSAELASLIQTHEMTVAAASYATDSLLPAEVESLAAFLSTTAEDAPASLGDAVVLTAVGILILLSTAAAVSAANRRERHGGGSRR